MKLIIARRQNYKRTVDCVSDLLQCEGTALSEDIISHICHQPDNAIPKKTTLYPRSTELCCNTKACAEIFTVILFLVDMI